MKPSISRIARAAALVLGTLALAGATHAREAERRPVVVFKDGRSMSVINYEQRGRLTYITDAKGVVAVVRSDSVDFERSRKATEAALRGPTPPPTPIPKKSIVEVSREIQERRRRAAAAAEPEATVADLRPPPNVLPGRPTLVVTPVVVRAASPPPVVAPVVTPPPSASASPEPEAGVTLSSSPSATPEAVVPGASTSPEVATPEPSIPAPPESLPMTLWAGIAVALAGAAAGIGLLVRQRLKPAASAKGSLATGGARAPAVAADDELLTPAFADEEGAEDLPAAFADDAMAAPAELAGGTVRKALAAGPRGREGVSASMPSPVAPPPAAQRPPSVLEEGREVQIRIGPDVYTCPDVASLRRWVEEGRVIETSEILSAEGSWLMAGSIADLEESFERRRETLGY